jgi:hypothetical protein
VSDTDTEEDAAVEAFSDAVDEHPAITRLSAIHMDNSEITILLFMIITSFFPCPF